MKTLIPSTRRHFLTRRLLLAAATGGVTTACIQVDAEVPKACFLQSDVVIPAVEVNGIGVAGALDRAEDAGLDTSIIPTSGAVEESFTRDGLNDITDTFDSVGVTGRARLLQVDVTAIRGLEDFSIIERIAVRMAPVEPNAALPPMVLAACDASQGCDTLSSQVTLSGDSEQDLVPYLELGTLEFTLELAGSVPLEEWAFDVDVCMSGGANFEASL